MDRFIASRLLLISCAISCVFMNQHAHGALPLETKVTLQCRDQGNACRVEFDISESERHIVELVREEHSVFAPDAVLASLNGDHFRVADRTLEGVRYHSKLEENSKNWGTALVSHDGTELLDGIFSTEKHGVVEWTKNGDQSSHRRRLTEDLHDDLVLEMPGGRPWMKNNDNGGQNRMADLSTTSTNVSAPYGVIAPFFPNCFTGDSVTHTFRLNMVYDYGLYQQVTANVVGDDAAKMSKLLSDLETLFSFGKLLYLSQFNLRLVINKVVIGGPNDPGPLSRGGTLPCLGALSTMTEWVHWLSTNNNKDPAGYWMLMSNCFSGGINGVSYIGNACGNGNNGGVAAYSWNVIFHELGHGLGSTHSFEYGVGKTGGIMDYGDIVYNGVIQFHPLKRPEVCSFLDYLKTKYSCPHLQAAPSSTECGDGVLDKKEQCECIVQGSKSCGQCQNCKLTDPKIECSSADFVVRQPSTPDILVVDKTALASPQCCPKNKLAPPKTLCGNTMVDVCGLAGQCIQTCSLYLLTNNPVCNFDDSGCMIGCVWKNRCRFDMTYTKSDGSDGYVSALPDGSACSLPSGGKGMCINAQCLSQADANRVNGIGTSAPSQAVPVQGTNQPSQAPISRKRTNRPSASPTTSRPSTAPNSTAASSAEITRCAAFSNKRRCVKLQCKWCSSICIPQVQNCAPPASLKKKSG